ncbi:MAG TPA: RNA polymerase sigma factor [Longimicrobium sp.]
MIRVEPGGSLVELIREAAGGDEDALEGLLVRVYRIARAFVRRRLPGSADDAFVEDAASETVSRVAHAFTGCRARNEGEAVAWILEIARNTAIDLHRVELRQVIVGALDDLDLVGTIPAPVPGSISPAEGALLDLLGETHEALPAELQLLLWTRLVGGATWAEAGEQIGTTSTAAKRRYQRAQMRLRRELTRRIHQLPGPKRVLVIERLAALGVQL